MKQLIQNGELGRIDVIHTAFSELYTPGRSLAWLVDPKLAGGGPLMDLGIYCVNTTRWLVNEDPTEVSAQTWTPRHGDVPGCGGKHLVPLAVPERPDRTGQLVLRRGFVVLRIRSGHERLGFAGARV